ncbi:YceI family protein [Tamlana fucoidanivorans]|uniref:YceI family protein n=1 Tax=Allotamlana fucoidanivorans TaxID=2583814 RepID=A0A5C4SFQ8_9FLAO|nr:YceI family protein [Tamlana fucoidanivorans]TNJ42143.1 YceI family protein [Tamlana fucoidanivorans]
MNTQRNILKRLIVCFTILGFTSNVLQAQILKLENTESSLTVFGSSNVHGWKVQAETKNGSIKFNDIETCQIEHLSFAVLTKSLKGPKAAMTKTATETLKADKHKIILFTLVEVKNITNKGNGVFELQTVGDLMIAGTKKTVPLNFDVTIINDKVKLTGKTQLKMTEFNLTPPQVMMGAIKAKDDIVLRFETSFVTEANYI